MPPNRKRPPLQRLNPTSFKKTIFGVGLDGIKKQFGLFAKWEPVSFRVYRVPGERDEPTRFIAKVGTGYGEQLLYEVLAPEHHGGSLQFKEAGRFAQNFGGRVITDETLKKKGLGSAALRYYLGTLRKSGTHADLRSTRKKSTARLFLRHGYRIIVQPGDVQHGKEMDAGQIEDYVKRDDTPEGIPFIIRFVKRLKREAYEH